MNRDQIRNPHWIYPGQIVYFDRVNRRLSLTRPGGGGADGIAGTTRLSPQIRTEGLGVDAVQSIPAGVIEPFLSMPLIVEDDELDGAPRIAALEEGHVYLGKDEKFYVRGDLKGGSSFQVFRPGNDAEAIRRRGRMLAYEAVYLGTVKLQAEAKPGVDVHTFTVSSSKQEMGVGDRLMPAPPTPMRNYVPHQPERQIGARVLSIYSGVTYAGQNQVVSVNRGSVDGLDVGAVLQLYHFGKTVADPGGSKGLFGPGQDDDQAARRTDRDPVYFPRVQACFLWPDHAGDAAGGSRRRGQITGVIPPCRTRTFAPQPRRPPRWPTGSAWSRPRASGARRSASCLPSSVPRSTSSPPATARCALPRSPAALARALSEPPADDDRAPGRPDHGLAGAAGQPPADPARRRPIRRRWRTFPIRRRCCTSRAGPNCWPAPALAVVGSRNATLQGKANAEVFAQALSCAGLTIVSGLALGIDAAAHQGALGGVGSTVAVIGTGADTVYPARNHALAHRIAAEGCIVSEYALGTPPLAANFPRRNRIISGLAAGVLVVEAAAQSGSLITAQLAASQGRDVFAIPGSIHSALAKGCHKLIKEGAKLVESAADVLGELRMSPLAAMARDAGRPRRWRIRRRRSARAGGDGARAGRCRRAGAGCARPRRAQLSADVAGAGAGRPGRTIAGRIVPAPESVNPLCGTCARANLTDRVEPCSISLSTSTKPTTVRTPVPSRKRWRASCRRSGFDDVEISEALVWLTDLTEMAGAEQSAVVASTGTRFYVAQEFDALGSGAIGFIQFLESAKVISALQREIVIERALALGESPVGLGKLKIIVLMLLWSQGKEPDALMFDDLFGSDDEQAPRLLH